MTDYSDLKIVTKTYTVVWKRKKIGETYCDSGGIWRALSMPNSSFSTRQAAAERLVDIHKEHERNECRDMHGRYTG